VNHQLDDVTTFHTLLTIDYSTRLEKAVEKVESPVSRACPDCGVCLKTDRAVRGRGDVSWVGPCDCGSVSAEYVIHTDTRGGDWNSWKGWSTGRLMFEPDIEVMHAVWRTLYDAQQERIYMLTKPLIVRKPMIEGLQKNGWSLTFREPRNYDAPPSMESRYEAAGLWLVSLPDEARVWNLFVHSEHVALQEHIVSLMADVDSSDEGASLDSLGSTQAEYLRELKTKCFEIKLANRQEGEGAFKLLSILRSTLARVAA